MAFLRLLGNKVIAGGYLPWAQTKLSQLRRLLAIQGNDVGMRRYSLVDADILVTKNFLVENIIITGKGGVGIPVLFLITSLTEYAAWNISRGSNGVVTLAPKSIKFPDMEEVASDIQHCDTKTRVPFIYPSTVKSNSDYNRHRFAKANVPIIPGSFGSNSINRYGSYGYYYYKGIWYCFYDGIRSCWQPSNFNLNNVERWVNSWFNGEPDYVCSARHFFQTYFETPESTNPEINEIAIKNLEFWR